VNSINSYQHDKNSEISYLGSLISAFGAQSGLSADESIKRIYARYSELEKKRSNVLQTTTDDVDGYRQLCLKVHAFLYRDILYNAGKIRLGSDPNGGNVYFGGIAQRTMRDKFVGTRPELIERELDEAFSILFDEKYNYIERSIRFYAEFVAIHPFYDANGRISRYIIDVYLQHHRHYVDWQSINKSHGKFLRKLNYCHSVRTKYKQYLYQLNLDSDIYARKDAYWKSVREQYIGYLLSFWTKFVLTLPDSEIYEP
jgi:fido (protein-threonine AMPylation protein)